MLLAPRNRLLAAFIGILIFAGGAFYYTSIAPESARERLSLADGGTGRTDIWKVGWRMVEDKPVTGVGAANFQISSIHYLAGRARRAEGRHLRRRPPAVAHNAFLSMLAELGIPGLRLLPDHRDRLDLVRIRAAKEFGRRGDPGMELIAASVAVALVALLAADLFVSEQYNKQLWLLMALSPAMLSVARDRATED